jgi:uncharacterized protein (DUF2141 family)
MKKLNLISLLALIAMLVSSFQNPEKGSLTVSVTGLRNDKGELNVNLFNSSDGFPSEQSKAFKHGRGKISKGACIVTFENLPYGEYAVGIYHDENNDKKLNNSAIKWSEGMAVSNNAKGFFGPPKFADAKVELNSKVKEVPIIIQYSWSH